MIAVDWSGALRLPARTIWLAEFADGSPARLEKCESRDKVVERLLDASKQSSKVVVGLDFAFSCAGWFVQEQQCRSAIEFWSVVKLRGEKWLRDCPHPFWGRCRRVRPVNTVMYRRTEQELNPVNGITPKSVFQLAGPGHVGTGSLRGMPFLAALLDAGFSVWPFQEPSSHVVIEIYPRILTGAVIKRSPEARMRFLDNPDFASFTEDWRTEAAGSEHAFDAAVSVCVMNKHLHAFESLKKTTNPQLSLEGIIWDPRRSN